MKNSKEERKTTLQPFIAFLLLSVLVPLQGGGVDFREGLLSLSPATGQAARALVWPGPLDTLIEEDWQRSRALLSL